MNGALHSDFMFVDIEPYKSKKDVPYLYIKLSKYCDIDARLGKLWLKLMKCVTIKIEQF